MPYKKQSEPTDEVQALIEIANSHPTAIELPKPDGWGWTQFFESVDPNTQVRSRFVVDLTDEEERREKALWRWRADTLSTFGADRAGRLISLLDKLGYAFSLPETGISMYECDEEIEIMLCAVYYFNRIVNFFNCLLDLRLVHDWPDQKAPRGSHTRGYFPVEHLRGILDARERTIRFVQPIEMKVLDGCSIDRIKRCEVCGTFFWAKRLPSYTCGKGCGNVFNARMFRIREAEQKLQAERMNKEKLLKHGVSPTSGIIGGLEAKIARMEERLRAQKSRYDPTWATLSVKGVRNYNYDVVAGSVGSEIIRCVDLRDPIS